MTYLKKFWTYVQVRLGRRLPPNKAAISSVLKESAEARTDAELLTAATQASMLAAEWNLRYDLEYAPQYASAGWQKIQKAIGRANEHAALLDALNELHQRGKSRDDRNWFKRKIAELFNRRVEEIPAVAVEDGSSVCSGTPSVFVWQDGNHRTRSVVVDVRVEREQCVTHAPAA